MEELIDKVIDQIKDDLDKRELLALHELLLCIPKENLESFLSEANLCNTK
jgi:hypothetical protein|tara:strand:+ start:49 stop:198 length:150 start_codon:yes stop_codon:yes gene_type:complete